ncbi:MAG: hypothetical protein RMM30_11365 [Armatimonadota bacterium]|nr:hypothetical protein [Armatimonadota bacterium]MDW8157169.1 hypothetical protein [Armatimonadota bacterium]
MVSNDHGQTRLLVAVTRSRKSELGVRVGPEQPAHGFGRFVVIDEARRIYRVDAREVPGIRVTVTGSFVDVALPVEALQPRTSEWEIQVETAYLGRDNVYWRVDWLAWTRITF